MHSEPVLLDVTKRHEATEKIHLRRGESGLTSIDATITDGAKPYDLTGCSITFQALDAQKRYVIGNAKITAAKDGKVSYVITSHLTSLPGEVHIAYFEIKNATNTITTPGIPIVVLDNVDLSGVQADEYESEISQLLQMLEEGITSSNIATDAATQAADKANEAAQRLENADKAATTAANSANSAAKNANDSALAADQATAKANTAGDRANAAAESAAQASADASKAADDATQAASAANEAAERVDDSIQNAELAADKANKGAERVEEAVENAYSAAGDAVSAASASREATKRLNEAMEDFNAVLGTEIAYSSSFDPINPPDDEWTIAPKEVDQGAFQWVRTITHFYDGTSTTAYSIAHQGIDGRDGIGVEASNLCWFWVDEHGDFWATYTDGQAQPKFRYDQASGNFYAVV